MAFEEIDNLKPVSGLDACPSDGLRVWPRKFAAKTGLKRWIQIAIGVGLARRLALTLPQQLLRVLFGTGEDAGQLLIAADQTAGKFLAKRDKQGRYILTIGSASAARLFALEFPGFLVIAPEVLRAPGCPPSVCFPVSAEMLKAEEDEG